MVVNIFTNSRFTHGLFMSTYGDNTVVHDMALSLTFNSVGLIVNVKKITLLLGQLINNKYTSIPPSNIIANVDMAGGLTTTPYYDDFESRATGVTGLNIGSMYISDNTQGGVTIATADKHSGSKSLRVDYTNFSFPEYGKAMNPTNRAYQACWFKFNGTTNTVWKFGRFGYGTPYGGSPHVAASYTSSNNVPSAFSGEVVTGANGGTITSYSDHNTATASPSSRFTPNVWHFYEMELYTGTVDGNNMHWEERIDGVATTKINNRPYLTSANPNLITWMISPMDGMGVNTNVQLSVDEMYVDESMARVVLTDNATYASSTKWSIQPIRGKSNSGVTFDTRRGMFNIGDTGYYHCFNHLGTLIYSSGALTVQADVTLP